MAKTDRRENRPDDAPRVLCVTPWIHDFAAYDLWVKPLGLLYVAAAARGAGYRVEMLDLLNRWDPELLEFQGRAEPRGKGDGRGPFHKEQIDKPSQLRHVPRRYSRYGLPPALAEAKAARFEPQAILVTSGMTYWYPGVQATVELLRRVHPGVPILLGGIYATLLPDHARQVSGADEVVAGPGEAEAIRWLDGVFGVRREEEEIERLGEWKTLRPALDLAPYGTVPLQTSRGCPFRCPYCASRSLHERFVQRDPEAIVEEIVAHCELLDTRDVVLYDDSFLVRPERHFLPIAEGLRQRDLVLRFHAPNGLSPRFISLDVARAMKAFTFRMVRLSLESVDDGDDDAQGSKVTAEEFVDALRNLEKAGVPPRNVEVYLMMGLPGQTPDDVRVSVDFVQDLGARVRLSSFTPIPGTRSWRRAIELGRIDEDADPLLLNNTLYPLSGPEMAPAWQKLRDDADARNHLL